MAEGETQTIKEILYMIKHAFKYFENYFDWIID